MKTTSFSRLEKASLLIRQNRTSLYRCRRYYSFCKFLFISQRVFVGSVYIVACTSRDISQQILMRRSGSLVKIIRHPIKLRLTKVLLLLKDHVIVNKS